jgi:serine/threonine-protein kinase
MKLARDEWERLSALLDQALEIDEAGQEAWLQQLPRSAASLEQPLRVLLAQRAYVETDEFLKAPDFAAALRSESAKQRSGLQDLQPGAPVGGYRLIRELGQGGMGCVWLAERTDGRLKRQVALKFPYPGPYQRQLAERLGRERDILARLEHPNIARLYDADVTSLGQPFLVLEYVDGIPINDYCDRGRLGIRARMVLFLQVLGALQYAHANLVIHRDLKPSNIFVTNDGVVRLLDFGIAKLVPAEAAKETALTQFGGRALTPDYASPEQIAGRPITTASDVYSLGVVLYELLTGNRPYRLKRDSLASLEDAISEADVIAPSRAVVDAGIAERRSVSPSKLARLLRGDVDAIMHKALQKEAAARYASVDAFMQDIKHWLDDEVVEAQGPSVWHVIAKLVRRNRLLFASVAAVMLALITGAALAVWQARAAIAQSERLQATKGFLIDIFNASSKEQNDPMKAQQTTARDLLDRAADRLLSERRPSVEETEEMLSILGDLYLDLGLDDKSAALRERRVALVKQLYGPDDVRTAEAEVIYAQALYATDRWKQASTPLQDAERILDERGDTTSMTRALLWQNMAEYLRGVDRNRARQYAERAVALYRRKFPKSPEFVEALRVAALIESEIDNRGSALAFLKEALGVQEATGAPETQLLRPLVEIAELEGREMNYDAAERDFKRGLEISQRINGELHVDSIQSRLRFGKFLRNTGRLRESQQMLTTAEQNAVKLLGDTETFHLPTVRDELAQTEYALGNFEVAADLFRRAIAVRETQRSGNRQHANMLQHYARLLTDMGHADESQRLLVRAIDYYEKSGVPVGASEVPVVMSAAHSSLGQHREALKVLDRFAADRGRLTATMTIELELRRASVLADMDDLGGAESLIREQLLKLNQLPQPQYFRLLAASGQVQLGRLLMRRDAAQEACGILDSALNVRLDDLSPQSPLVADSEAALAECVLSSGDAAKARSLLLKARAIDADHVELSHEFREPVQALSRRLLANRGSNKSL